MGYELIAFLKQDTTMYSSKYIQFLESIITTILFLEILVRLVIQKAKFWRACWNIVDLVNVVLVSFILYIDAHLTAEDNTPDTRIFPVILLWIRFVIQIIRTINAVKANKAIMEASQLKFDLSCDYEDLDYTKDRRRSLVFRKKTKKSEQSAFLLN